MKRKYIPVPVVVGSPIPPTPVINRMSESEWASLDFAEKVAEGLTLVGNEKSVTGSWYDLTNALIDFTPVLSRSAIGTVGIDETYTAIDAGDYLIFNIETVGEAQAEKKTAADITTTGTEICNVENTSEYTGSGDRDMSCVIAVVSLGVGDTVTLSNNHNNNYASQTHLIFKTVNGFDLSNVVCKSRSIAPFTETYTALENEKVIAFVIDDTPAGDYAVTSVVTSGGDMGSYSGGIARSKISVINADMVIDDTVTMETGTYTNYGTKTFLVYEIIPA